MLSTIALVVAGLSSGHKIGLAAVGATFIVFALVSSFVLPRRDPNFPGRHMALYVTICACFFVAMMAAVLVFGKEKSEAKGAEEPTPTQSAPAPTTTASAPTTTAPAPTTTGEGGGGGEGEAKGDPAAGKAVFTGSAGCSGCHTLKAAGATGTVGPNLDQLKPSEDAVKSQVEHGGGVMPAFKGQLTDKQIEDVAAFVFASTHS